MGGDKGDVDSFQEKKYLLISSPSPDPISYTLSALYFLSGSKGFSRSSTFAWQQEQGPGSTPRIEQTSHQ